MFEPRLRGAIYIKYNVHLVHNVMPYYYKHTGFTGGISCERLLVCL